MATLVSIVTPSYQQAPFLESTLRSVLGQRGEFELDYIVVDGGSTDGTVAILREWERRLACGEEVPACRKAQFRWLSERDRGQANAINKGFRLAAGQILAWLNSDDTYADERAIAKCVEFFQSRPAARFVFGKGYKVNARGEIVGEEDYVTRFTVADLPEIDMILQPAAFWHREVYDTVGELNEALTYAFDWEYWLRCQRHFALEFLDEFLACNRFHDATKTNTGGIARKREIVELLLTHGKFTERAVITNLLPPPPIPPPVIAAGTQRERVPPPKGLRGVIRTCRQYVKAQLRSLRAVRHAPAVE